MNDELFVEFIKKYFIERFSSCENQKGRRFLRDGCPVQNSKMSREAYETTGAMKFSILPRSTDFNPIENIYNKAKTELRSQAIKQNIAHETFQQFSLRVKTLLNIILLIMLIRLLNQCQRE